MTQTTLKQQVDDLTQQCRAWETIATNAIAARADAERQLASTLEREAAQVETVRRLQTRVADMSDLVATTIGHVEQVTAKAKQVAEQNTDAAIAADWRAKFETSQEELSKAKACVERLETHIKATGESRADSIRQGAMVMRERIASHVRTHPNKALGAEIANHIRYAIPLPTEEDVVAIFDCQPPKD